MITCNDEGLLFHTVCENKQIVKKKVYLQKAIDLAR